MNDRQFLEALENCTLPAAEFGHAAHVRACYLYLTCGDFLLALVRLRDSIRRYAIHLGQPRRYHETMTVAYAALIHERMAECAAVDWPSFARQHTDLCEPGLLERFYSPALLASERARRIFLLPRPG